MFQGIFQFTGLFSTRQSHMGFSTTTSTGNGGDSLDYISRFQAMLFDQIIGDNTEKMDFVSCSHTQNTHTRFEKITEAIARFTQFIDAARSAGLGITVHTGENTSADCVRKSMDLYKPDRIGHGIQAWRDETLINRIGEENIMLELCPTSNWLTNSVPSIDQHPLPLFYRRGIPLSINSDDPHLMNIDLVREYEICVRYYGLHVEDFFRINRESVLHSFLPEEIKRETLNRFFR